MTTPQPNPDEALALPPLQDMLTRIFDDAGGSDALTDLLREFDFEGNRELAEALVVMAADGIRTTDAARVTELERMLGLAHDWIDADDFRNMGPAEDRLHTKLIRDIEATLNRSARHAD